MANPIAIKRINETDWEVIYGHGEIKAARQYTMINGEGYHVKTKYYRNPGQEPLRIITGAKILIAIGIFYLLLLAGPNILAGLGTLWVEFMAGLGRLMGG